jgi:ABC-type sugar transport system permease subunit
MLSSSQSDHVPLLNAAQGGAPKRSFSARLRNSQALKGYLYISPWLIGFLLLGLWPLIQTFYYSFTSFNLFNDPEWVGFKNYVTILTKDPIFVQASINMLIYVVSATTISIGGGLLLALALNQKFPGNHFFRIIIYVPSLLVGVAIAKLFRAIFVVGPNGLANTFLSLFHIGPLNWLADFDHPWMALLATILVNLWFMGGSMLIFLAGLKGISPSYYEAARVDGAGRWSTFWRVTLPLLSPVVVFNTIMAVIGHMQVFETPLVFAASGGSVSNAGQNSSILGYHNTLAVYLTYIYKKGFLDNEYGYASALAVITFIITFVLSLIVLATMRLSRNGDQGQQ